MVNEVPEQPRAYTTSVQGDVLTVVIYREFNSGILSQDWDQFLTTRHPGPFREIHLDMSRAGRLHSTFYAGLMRLHHTFTAQGTKRVVLLNPDRRLLSNLKILHFEKYFEIG